MDHRRGGHDRPPLGALPPGRGGSVRLSTRPPADPGGAEGGDRFVVRHERATAATLAGRAWPEPARRSVWVVEVDRPTLVLGSTQADTVVDGARAAAAGVEVVRRRSGGGAVLLLPGETVWVDVLLPADDPLAEADVGRAFAWLGRAWAAALAMVGLDGTHGPAVAVHAGPPRSGAWSELVCFAGLGPGEVTVGGAKAVGISQRRTRAGALFQCGALVEWNPRRLLHVLALSDDDRAAAGDHLDRVAVGTGVAPARLVAALVEALNPA